MSQEAMLSKQYMTGWWCDDPDSDWAWRGNLLFQFSFYGMSGEPNFPQKESGHVHARYACENKSTKKRRTEQGELQIKYFIGALRCHTVPMYRVPELTAAEAKDSREAGTAGHRGLSTASAGGKHL